jgi:hypothetical protein
MERPGTEQRGPGGTKEAGFIHLNNSPNHNINTPRQPATRLRFGTKKKKKNITGLSRIGPFLLRQIIIPTGLHISLVCYRVGG